MDTRTEQRAADLLALFGTGGQSPRFPDLDFPGAYAIAERIRALRQTRGERPVGRKIGFTNTTIWERYGVTGPMWNFIYDTTVHDLADVARFDLAGLSEPRIEPEIVLHLATAPDPGMDEHDLLACIDWIAHGFEIVQSVYPGWRLTGPEAAAAFGLHGALFIGERHDITANRATWQPLLRSFAIRLANNGGPVAEGHAAHVLGGPVSALRFLVAEIARYPANTPLAAGEIVTTGTLTDAQPITPGDLWSTALAGIPLAGISLEF